VLRTSFGLRPLFIAAICVLLSANNKLRAKRKFRPEGKLRAKRKFRPEGK
jgi:hypothetical protein